LHGFPEAAFVWDAVLQHFAQPAQGHYRCVAPNLRGYGHSSAPTDKAAYRAKHLVQDVAALIALCRTPGQPVVLVAHDWGGAVAWNLAASLPEVIDRLIIINAPHPATFLRELAHNPAQQAASAYMNFLARPDAPELLAANDFARLWPFFEGMGAVTGPHAWLTDAVREQYRNVWRQGLQGPCHYYGASPLRPPTANDPAATAVRLPPSVTHVPMPTLVIWGMADTALPPSLLDGLDEHIPHLHMAPIPDGTHWVIHEQPATLITLMSTFINN
jgi:pimeloyl-ACP methyl ester carboxylesterase